MSTEETPDCGCDYEPMTYLGMFRCQQNEEPEFFRSQFQNRQLDTELAYWEIMTDTFERYYPQVMCDPCMSGPKLSFAEALDVKYAKPFTLKNEIAISCGQIKHRIRPGETELTASSWLQQFQEHVARQTLLQSAGFDAFERDITAELMITQQVVFPKSEYLPEGLTVSYPRHEDLDCTTPETFGAGQTDCMSVIEDWLNKLECFENSNRVTDIIMHHETWRELKKCEDFKECLKSYNPQLFLSNQLLNQFNQEPVITPRGVTRVYTDPNGIRYWTVNMTKKAIDETGAVKKYDMMPKNKLIAYDFSGGECSYSPLMIYTPIMDMNAALEAPEQINAARYATTFVDRKKRCWERELTSNLMPVLPYPNASSCLTLGVANKATERKTLTRSGSKTEAAKTESSEKPVIGG